MARISRRLKLVLACVPVGFVGLAVLTSPPRSAQPAGPLLAGASIDPQALSILQRSCQDCHSDATRYPWYSYVPPASLLIQNDVEQGRKHLNLSRWNEYSIQRKERALSEIANQVKDNEMPIPQYLWIHKDAKLSSSDVTTLFQWTQSERARLIAENSR